MANFDDYSAYHAPEADSRPARAAGLFVQATGGLVSIGLIAGLAVWGYQLLVRDVAGVPVIQALEGPMRIAPEDPGGQLAQHQGLAVNDIPGEGEAAPPPDRLVLAPRDAVLTDEDDTLAALNATAAAPVEGEAIVPMAEAAEPMPVAAPANPIEAALALVEDLPQPETAAFAPEVIPASVPGLRRSPVPQLRPAALNLTPTSVAASVPAAATTAAVVEIDPSQVAAGTRLVQLGAFDSPEVARAEWTRISSQFEDYFGGKSRVIQQAQSGGKTFYRLRVVGFADLSDARRFCAALMAEGAACIPAAAR